MKKNIIYFVLGTLALGTALTSCHDDPTYIGTSEPKTGELQLASMSIDMSDAEIVINSSVGRATVDLNDYTVTISDQSENSEFIPRTYRYADMPEVLTLPVSENYMVEVKSHNIAKAEWDKPYYYGSKTFAIQDGKITQIGTVTAKFSSLRVTVKFTDELLALLGEESSVTVMANNTDQLVFTPATKVSGFFDVEGLQTLVAHFEGTVDGVKTTFDTPFTGIKAGQHHIITYKIKTGPSIPDQSGNIDPSDGIIVDADVDVEEVDGNLVVDEDLIDSSGRPGQEEQPKEDDDNKGDNDGDDPSGDEPAATFEAVNSPKLDLSGVNTPSDDFGNAIVGITCPAGIKNLVVNIHSTSDTFRETLAQIDMPLTFDLAYPGEYKETLESLQLKTGSDVIGHTYVEFNISDFVGLLKPFVGDHNFILSVTDANNMCETMTLRFHSDGE